MSNIFDARDVNDTLQRLINNLPGFVYRCKNDAHWTMIYISDQCLEITGYEPDDFIDNKVVAYDYVIEPSYRFLVHQAWSEAIRKREPFRMEYKIVHKDGSVKWVLEQGRAVFCDSSGQLLYLDGYIADITDRVKALDDLINISKLKSFFLANLSHELRTPLNAIIGFAEILSEEGLDAEEKNYCVEVIGKSTNSLLRVIDDIIIASKIETNQLKLSIGKIEITTLIEKLESLIENFNKVASVPVILNFEVETLPVSFFSDIKLIINVITRLIDNSIRFSYKGSVIVKLSYSLDNNHLLFSVIDNGHGIDSQESPKIFHSFFRGGSAFNTNTRGAGLGLFISKAYASLLQGTLEFSSTPNKETVFYFSIPATPSF